MQEDSPGSRGKRTRNERYSTPTKPKQLSVKAARQKAKEFATKDDKSTRVLAKQAILKELSTQLVVRAHGVVPKNRSEEEHTKDHPGTMAENMFHLNQSVLADMFGGKFEYCMSQCHASILFFTQISFAFVTSYGNVRQRVS